MNRSSILVVSGLPFLFAVASSAVAQITTRESLTGGGHEYASDSGVVRFGPAGIALPGGGRVIAFLTKAALDPRDTNNRADVYVRNRQTGAVIWTTLDPNDAPRDSDSVAPRLSNDGRFLAYGAVVPFGPARFTQVFVRDLSLSTTALVSRDLLGTPGYGNCYTPDLSSTGRFVAFASEAPNLVQGDVVADCQDPLDPNQFANCRDVFVRDRDPDGDGVFDDGDAVTTLESRSSSGEYGNALSNFPRLSGDGRFLAFASDSSNLVPDDLDASGDVFVRDRSTGQTECVSVDAAGHPVGGREPAISGSGRFVAFTTDAALDPADTNGIGDVYVRDRVAGTTVLASPGPDGARQPAISSNGRRVSFDTPSCCATFQHVFLRDLDAGVTIDVAVNSTGEAAAGDTYLTAVSGDGRFVAFASGATNLVPNDGNGAVDVFVRDTQACGGGTVNAASGPVTDVLRVGGSADFVTVPIDAPVVVRLDPPPAGPAPASYALWVWNAYPANQYALVVGGATLGCVEGATPFQPTFRPQPFKCVRGGLPSAYCAGTSELRAAPPVAPWQLTRARGFSRTMAFTLQGVIQDAGATNSAGLSVTNAVLLRIE